MSACVLFFFVDVGGCFAWARTPHHTTPHHTTRKNQQLETNNPTHPDEREVCLVLVPRQTSVTTSSSSRSPNRSAHQSVPNTHTPSQAKSREEASRSPTKEAHTMHEATPSQPPSIPPKPKAKPITNKHDQSQTLRTWHLCARVPVTPICSGRSRAGTTLLFLRKLTRRDDLRHCSRILRGSESSERSSKTLSVGAPQGTPHGCFWGSDVEGREWVVVSVFI